MLNLKKLLKLENLLKKESKPLIAKDLFKEASTTTTATDTGDADEQDLLMQITHRSSQLLKNTLAFNSKLQQDNQVLGNFEQELGNKITSVKSRRKEVKKVGNSTWKTTIIIWVCVLFSFLVVGFMILFIKIFTTKRSLV